MARKILVVGLMIGIFLVARCFIAEQRSVRNAYALWWTGSMITEAIKSGQFDEVHSFEDLRPFYENLVTVHGRPWEFDDIAGAVIVDFETIRLHLDQSEIPSPDVAFVSLRDGELYGTWAGADPNVMIRDCIVHLKSDDTSTEETD